MTPVRTRTVTWYLLRFRAPMERDTVVNEWRARFGGTRLADAMQSLKQAIVHARSFPEYAERPEQVHVIEIDSAAEDDRLLSLRFILDCNGLIEAAWQEDDVIVVGPVVPWAGLIDEAIEDATR